MELFNKYALALLVVLLMTACSNSQKKTIDLSGTWVLSLDSANEGQEEEWYKQQLQGDEIVLPSTLDEAEIGEPHQLALTLTNDVLF